MTKSSPGMRKTTKQSSKNAEQLKKKKIRWSWNWKKPKVLKRNWKLKSENLTIKSPISSPKSLKKKNSFPHSGKNKPKSNSQRNYCTKNSPPWNFNLKPRTNSLNSLKRRTQSLSKRLKKTKKITKTLGTNSSSPNNTKTTTQLSNIFQRELLSMNLKWSTSQNVISGSKSKTHKPIMFSKTKSYITLKCKTKCSEDNLKEKAFSMTGKSFLNSKKRTSRDQRTCWEIQLSHQRLET